ncbi:PREDICTED: LOW QUALITY PROTEIN: uncharacterized protein LOC104277906 [Apaloderma vittatum]|uniref:LOW QUALITY PROTEIN: uncharacterized protein LOC104277906 n=1 Tax=Apaloderma vittatum TaxID=57397 RepID=UPI0005213A29|nr:PREDICTED: LOW QUALITY PROTEIN: uncharacterized protein LOC104277906 [Apaloderma vittatum]
MGADTVLTPRAMLQSSSYQINPTWPTQGDEKTLRYYAASIVLVGPGCDLHTGSNPARWSWGYDLHTVLVNDPKPQKPCNCESKILGLNNQSPTAYVIGIRPSRELPLSSLVLDATFTRAPILLVGPGDMTFTRASIFPGGPGLERLSLTSPAGLALPLWPPVSQIQTTLPGFGTTCCLSRRGDLVQERHGNQLRAARAISSLTPMWWMANGVHWCVTRRYITRIYDATSVCLHQKLNAIGYRERVPIFSYSAISSSRQTLTTNTEYNQHPSMSTFRTLICFLSHTADTVPVSQPCEHESVLQESMVNAVSVNKTVRRSKSFTECAPVRKVRLEVTSSGNVQDNSLWRTHLGIHRLGQASCEGVTRCKNGPCGYDDERLISKGKGTLQHEESDGVSELSALSQLGSSSTLSSFSEENRSNISSTCQKPPLKSATSSVWTHQQISSKKCTPACKKVNFYPFPNKKGPEFPKQQGALDCMSHDEDVL